MDVILVDEKDRPVGAMEKMEVHQKALLHRAFSIFIFNSKGEMLLHKRAANKYHSGGLWTNTCCSHPLPGEIIENAVRRKLKQEMGIDFQPEFLYKFIYKTALNNELTEHEYDHVFTGIYDGTPTINKDEVADWKFVACAELKKDIELHPERYTYWFKLIVEHPKFNQWSMEKI